jgi:hypothetical protein
MTAGGFPKCCTVVTACRAGRRSTLRLCFDGDNSKCRCLVRVYLPRPIVDTYVRLVSEIGLGSLSQTNAGSASGGRRLGKPDLAVMA